MNSLKRRDFLALSLGGAAALSAQEPRGAFPTDPRARLSVSTYPFRHLIATPHGDEEEPAKSGMSLEEFAKTIGPRLNVPGIEPWSHHFKSTDPAYVRTLRDAFRSAGVHVVNIPVDIGARLCGSPEDQATYRKWVDAAAILGAPGIRVHLPHGEKGEEISCAVSGLKALAEYGASKNIVTNLENDEPEIEQPERIVRVIKTVNSPFLRALPDFCNSMIIHNDQNYNNQAMRMLFPLAFNISHVKDMEQDGKTVYRVDVDRIFAIAEKAGYKGYFSMEWEGSGDDPYAGTKSLIEASLRALG
ncbi:MAG: sugar phosphate isomerase/epimerase [Acidobacteriota bacterium]|nr:sugar phosphate isomerase/epimerase [Acidobacteriota bacterium]